ncbi:MAG TPA: SCO family protein [Pyrinomonadaceae bacterium]|jgi:protein SCO1/2
MMKTNPCAPDYALPRGRIFALISVALMLCCGGYASAAPTRDPAQQPAQAGHQPAPTPTEQPPAEQSPAQRYFTDVVLVNQNGERMRLYSDLLKGKVVIINAFFATCQASCLPLNRNLEKVQAALGDRVGRDVHIISISVDPTVDTPAALKAYAAKLHARPGWYFLTGERQNVELALRKLGQYVEDKQNHTNIFIIGNERTGLWKKAFGLAASAELIKIVESVLNDQPAGDR